MAVLGTQNLTLLDLAKRTDPDGSIATIVEALKQKNEILDDIVFKAGNLDTGHKATIRTGLPTPTWRVFNKGSQSDKSTTAQVTFTTGLLEQISEVDVDMVEIAANPQAARFTEDMAAMQAIQNEIARALFFGNESLNPEEMTGLAYYYNDLSAESGENIIDAGGTGSDNASIYLIGWSDNTISGIVPKNVTAGLRMKDLGTRIQDGSNNEKLEVYTTKMNMHAGLAVEDWRYGVRIANIDRSALTPDASSGANLPELMFQAMETIESLDGVTPVFYMDRNTRRFLRQQMAAAVSGSTLEFADVGGRRTALFQDIPVRRVDALAVNEARVV